MSVGEVALTLVLMDTYITRTIWIGHEMSLRLGAYTANLFAFYFYKLIGKLTAFLKLQ
jgi:hypothetical protein